MKNLKKLIVMAFLCLVCSAGFGQFDRSFVPQVSYNYNNKLLFKWLIDYDLLGNKKFDHIEETGKYTLHLYEKIDQIRPDLIKLEKIDVTYLVGKDISKVVVNSASSTTYQFRDSLLEFTGKHKVTIEDDADGEIQLFFNDINDLKELENIDFKLIKEKIERDAKNKKTISGYKTKELSFIQNQAEFGRYGLMNRQKHSVWGMQSTVLGTYMLGNFGIGVGAEFSRMRYMEMNDGRSALFSKIGLNVDVNYFDDPSKLRFSGSYTSIGFSHQRNVLPSSGGMNMLGYEIGAFGLGGSWAQAQFNTSQTYKHRDMELGGVYLGIVGETNKIKTALRWNIGDANDFMCLSVAYKF
ncbi:MAG: hypothetical protein H6607_05120 [Flavobacteriales bacterium]|nr:hypothetical protein [Flavobacteriales bacterium]